MFKNIEFITYNPNQTDHINFAVIVAKHNGKFVFVKHKERETFELPGGHREVNEEILETAKRELHEETGALDFKIEPLEVYKVTLNDGSINHGLLCYAEINSLATLPNMEIEKIFFLDKMPENLTYPLAHRKMFERGLILKSPSFHFDEKLRDVPNNIIEWKNYLLNLEICLSHELDNIKKLPLLEKCGLASRTLMKLDNAEKYLTEALNISIEMKQPEWKILQNKIRLAHVYQWMKNFDKAHLLFNEARAIIHENNISENLVASYHQHFGKLYFDQGFFLKAKVEFEKALEIRTRISAPIDHIESARASIAAVNKRLHTVAQG